MIGVHWAMVDPLITDSRTINFQIIKYLYKLNILRFIPPSDGVLPNAGKFFLLLLFVRRYVQMSDKGSSLFAQVLQEQIPHVYNYQFRNHLAEKGADGHQLQMDKRHGRKKLVRGDLFVVRAGPRRLSSSAGTIDDVWYLKIRKPAVQKL